LRVEAAPNAPKEPIAKSPAVEVGSGTSVRGLEEGLIGMKTNGSRRIIIPAELAYGKEGVPQRGIPPGVTLIFDVEHLEIIKK
jgi:FKBP-type peptidyl-prolyl cis-trans isomerase